MKINKNYKNINQSYLFSTIAKKVKNYQEINPNKELIKMGIGDVTLPLVKPITDAMTKAVADMGKAETFHGYGDEQGYSFLREKIKNYYCSNNVNLDLDEIFISDGAKSDLGNILDLFDKDNKVLIPSPVYPVYVDTNIMDGREIAFMSGTKENNFLPMPPKNESADIIYLCSPNNPTGAVYTHSQLKEFVDYAIENNAIILCDSAYESFVSSKELPRSIFEVDGAKKCAIEFCSLSKTAGFTGTRCGYTVVPKELGRNMNGMWRRRQCTKFNGVAYIVQRGAEAVFSSEGQVEIKKNIEYYRRNAKIITDTFDEMGIYYTGGINSPYIWLECGMGSWEFFDKLLNEAQVIGTPGEGFGKEGEGFFRLTAFNTYENTIEACKRIKKALL